MNIIAAMTQDDRVIGNKNTIPWKLPPDMKRFKEITMGKAVIMGRKTYESIGKPLPGRHNVVLSRDPDFAPEGCTIVRSLDEALTYYRNNPDAFCIGGAEIYKTFLPYTQNLYLTLIEAKFEGDAFFPPFTDHIWKIVSKNCWQRCEKSKLDYLFLDLSRRGPTFPESIKDLVGEAVKEKAEQRRIQNEKQRRAEEERKRVRTERLATGIKHAEAIFDWCTDFRLSDTGRDILALSDIYLFTDRISDTQYASIGLSESGIFIEAGGRMSMHFRETPKTTEELAMEVDTAVLAAAETFLKNGNVWKKIQDRLEQTIAHNKKFWSS